MAELSEWVFESVLQFLKSPLWTAPVHNFIEQHCHEFVSEETENKLIYTELHNKFRVLVDDLLTTFLEELGVSSEQFVEAIKCGGVDPELTAMVSEFIYALDDFPSFRAMMEKRNVELELEAMYEYAKYTSQAAESAEADMSDEERFLFEMAIHMSLGEGDIAMKRIEREDAELLQALALSMAIEQERLMYQQLLAEQQQQQQEGEDGSPPQRLRSVEQIHDEIRQKRVENVERALRDISAPPPPASEAKKIIEPVLAPIAEKRSVVFGQKGALPGIASSKASAPREPTFQELKRQVEEKLVAPAASSKPNEPTKEELEQRAAYFRAQREKLLQQKQRERTEQLSDYQQQQSLPAAPASDDKSVADAEARAMRIALARRFKEDLVQEARRGQQ